MNETAILAAETSPAPTSLALQLQALTPDLGLRLHGGALTPEAFSSPDKELAAAWHRLAAFDLGYRTRIRITGPDRLRWLNGMVSNAIQTLPEGTGNYNFILNAQGRIQGDAYIYRTADDLLLDTDISQAARLLAHLDHFIIMDDVELHPLDEATTGIGFIGPQAGAALDALGFNSSSLDSMQLTARTIDGIPVMLVRAHSVLVPRYELWFAPEHASTVWSALAAAGAEPIGIDAVEALRVLEGTPQFGIDFTDRHLPQETSQTRALNFTKGCYLGQEIVERIRSRATVHRNLRQFEVDGEVPSAPVDLRVAGEAAAIGQLTSIAEVRLPEFRRTMALGFIRTEAIERKSRIEYDGGSVTVLDHPPAP
jgi:folate-binding protein YgfZ